jgi:pyruvate/2-oxoglutarate dehydrogenase complex dihydrolipoamide acyltransferase (E2) component
MAGLLFVSQAMIDSWADQGRIDFVGNVMTLLSGEGRDRSYALEPAVRFLALLGADADPHRLLKKVKSLAQLRELGAEVVDASVVLGDVAYEVEPGFLAEPSALQAAAAARTAPAPAPAPAPAAPAPSPPAVARPASGPLPANLEARRKEAEELARFLLDKLS